MSTPQLRRADKIMADDRTLALLERGFYGRVATVGEDGYPYCVPLLYLWMDGEIYLHNSRGRGHFRANVDHEPRVCFQVDEAGSVFDYGRFECDSSVSYGSVVVFGAIRIIEDTQAKQRFCEAMMRKYRTQGSPRPEGFFPRLDQIAVYAIAVERMSGKENALPAICEQWPALDRTKTPHAQAPADR